MKTNIICNRSLVYEMKKIVYNNEHYSVKSELYSHYVNTVS